MRVHVTGVIRLRPERRQVSGDGVDAGARYLVASERLTHEPSIHQFGAQRIENLDQLSSRVTGVAEVSFALERRRDADDVRPRRALAIPVVAAAEEELVLDYRSANHHGETVP